MQRDHGWASVAAELDLWRDQGRTARLWLRDDDAVAPTQALDHLIGLAKAYHAPFLLAVIPMQATEALVSRLAGEPLIGIAVHGARHINHAPAGRKSEETPVERGLVANMADLGAARAKLVSLLGPEAGVWYVPPWNRIAPETAAGLPALGFRAVSTFGANHLGIDGLTQINTHVDIMDWRGGRVGQATDAVVVELASELARARHADFRPVGILTHHLDHDATAWATLEYFLARISTHPAARWIGVTDIPG